MQRFHETTKLEKGGLMSSGCWGLGRDWGEREVGVAMWGVRHRWTLLLLVGSVFVSWLGSHEQCLYNCIYELYACSTIIPNVLK